MLIHNTFIHQQERKVAAFNFNATRIKNLPDKINEKIE
jgi:hypothetical protein